ncbi:MAG: hypothetical protein ABI920_03810 [Casimicrobiaceae bacterium]
MPTALVLLALLLALAIGFAWGRARPDREPAPSAPPSTGDEGPSSGRPPVEMATGTAAGEATGTAAIGTAGIAATPPPTTREGERGSAACIDVERARLVRSLEAEAAALRRTGSTRDAALAHLAALAEERRQLFEILAAERAQVARYRQLVIDIETLAPPPILGGPGAPDDLKLIVGIGPVLERMLHQLGITTYRQIARWNDRDVDEFNARLAEFPGRIRRDAWVTQARALHQNVHGAAP